MNYKGTLNDSPDKYAAHVASPYYAYRSEHDFGKNTFESFGKGIDALADNANKSF